MFDGHGGGACAQVIAKRLFNYMTACLLPHENLLQYVHSAAQPEPPDLLQSYNDKVQFVEDVRDIYKESFVQFVKELAEVPLDLVGSVGEYWGDCHQLSCRKSASTTLK